MSNKLDLTYMKVLALFLDGRNPFSDRYLVSHPRKSAIFSIRNFLDIHGSFLVVKLLYRTRLRAFHVKHVISSLYVGCSFTFRRGESIFGSIFSLAFAKKGHFRQHFFARKTARSDETRTTSCQTR